MRCDRFRDAASARLDGEPLGMPAAALDGHLASCRECSAWAAAAEQVTRGLRLQTVAVPDLSPIITADVVEPARRAARWRLLARLGLVVAGVAQLVLASLEVGGTSVGMQMSMHADHEAAAWNLAIGVAFLATAVVPRRASGLVPLLAVFMVVLTCLSLRDVATGAVSAARVATHVAVLVGLILLFVLDGLERARPPGNHHTAAPVEDEPGLRGVA